MGALLREKGDGWDPCSRKFLSLTILVLPSLGILCKKKEGTSNPVWRRTGFKHELSAVGQREGSKTFQTDRRNKAAKAGRGKAHGFWKQSFHGVCEAGAQGWVLEGTKGFLEEGTDRQRQCSYQMPGLGLRQVQGTMEARSEKLQVRVLPVEV